MRVSTCTDYLAKIYGEEESIRRLAGIGYDCYDFSMFDIGKGDHPIASGNYERYVQRLRNAADESGIVCNQTHAPFPSYLQDNEEYNRRIFPLLIRAIEVTKLLGGKSVIIHPAVFSRHKNDDSLCLEMNMKLYRSLLPYAKEYDVKIALENMFNWYDGDLTASPATCSSPQEFVYYMDSLDPDYFEACLDIGHSAMRNAGSNSPAEMIRALGGKRLKALHVHDNDMVHDLHTLPFTQKLNWDDIMKSLKEIKYDGDFTFEADSFLAQFPDELAEHASRLMLEVGRYLIRKYGL